MFKKLCLVLIPLLFIACEKVPIEELAREELFSLKIGKMEDQVDLFLMDGVPSRTKNRIFMKDGMFYVSNGNALKVMKFTSFGDLLFLLYNPFVNPEPIVLTTEVEEGVVANRVAAKYSFLKIGDVVVDNNENIYVEDILPDKERVFDPQLQAHLTTRILRFDRKGTLLDFFGKDGLGSSLFPSVDMIFMDKDNRLSVISRTPTAWLVYVFRQDGSPLTVLKIDETLFPGSEENILNIDGVFSDYENPAVYVKTSLYSEVLDQDTKTLAYVEQLNSRVYRLSLTTGKVSSFIDAPDPGTRTFYTSTGEEEIPAPSYEFFGVSKGGFFFFMRPGEKDQYQLVVTNSKGEKVVSRYIVMDDRELFFKQIKLSSGGILYGMLSLSSRVDFVWWRSDKLLEEKAQ